MSLCRRTVLLRLLNVRIVIIYPNPLVALLTYTQKDHIMSTDHSNSQRSSAISNSAVEELNNDTAIKINGGQSIPNFGRNSPNLKHWSS